MPVVSNKQGKFMQAVANSPKFANKVGVKQSIGREFTKEKDMKKAVKKMNMGGMADREGRAMASGRYANDPRMMADARGRAMMKKGGATMNAKGKTMASIKKMKAGGPTARTKHIMNEKDEIRRVDKEIRDNEGYMKGGKVAGYKAGGMADKMGRALAKDNKGMSKAKLDDAGGRAMMKKGGATMKAKGKGMQGYNARLDDSLGARKGKKSQSLKSRRDESKGAKKAAGKKAYSGNRKSAQGKASKRADGIAQRGRTKGRIV